VRSTQQDDKPDSGSGGQQGNARQPDARPNGGYNRNNGSNNSADGPKREPPWTRNVVETYSKETSDLKDQVKQLTAKLNELTTKVSQPIQQQQPIENPYNQQHQQHYVPQQPARNYHNHYTPQTYQQPAYNGPQAQRQYSRPDNYVPSGSPSQSSTFGRPPSNNNQRNNVASQLCFNCQMPGHVRRLCPLLQQQNVTAKAAQDEKSMNNARGVNKFEKHKGHVYMDLKINGRRLQILLDTGCDVTIIPSDLVFRHNILQSNQKVLAANGTEIPILGRTILQAKLGGQDIEIEGLVSEHVSDIMVGIDWLQANGAVWNFAEGEISLNGQAYPLSPNKGGLNKLSCTACHPAKANGVIIVADQQSRQVANSSTLDVVQPPKIDEPADQPVDSSVSVNDADQNNVTNVAENSATATWNSVIPPCNYVIQRNKRSKPQVVHGDKLKVYHQPNPVNWKKNSGKNKPTMRTELQPEETEPDDQQFELQQYDATDIYDHEVTSKELPAKRTRKPSVRFKDYVVSEPVPTSQVTPGVQQSAPPCEHHRTKQQHGCNHPLATQESSTPSINDGTTNFQPTRMKSTSSSYESKQRPVYSPMTPMGPLRERTRSQPARLLDYVV